MSRGFASNYRIVLIATGLFACFAGLGVRLVFLHVTDREALLRTIVKTRHQVTLDMARRGDIFDRHGAILATSRPLKVIAIDPSMVRPEDEAKIPELAGLLGKPVADVKKVFDRKYRIVTVTSKPAAEASVGAAGDAAGTGLTLKLSLPTVSAAGAEVATVDGVDPEFARTMATANNVSGNATVATNATTDDDDEADPTPDQQGRRAIRWAKLSDEVTESTATEIEKLGLRCLCPPETRYARVYPHNELAAHLIGFANKENTGVAGLEAYADFYLRGQNGWREGEKDGHRHELAQFQTRSVPRQDGYSVVLSIDSVIQDIVEQELDKIGKTYQPLKATIIVSDPRTGFILGMANYPTFNPNEYNLVPKDQMSRMKNVAVSDVYEPGSVFKIVAASGAIEEGLANPQTTFNCGIDRIEYKGHDGKVRELKLPGEDHHFGQLTVAEIIAHSSNRGAAQLAMLLGEDRFERYARAFGFGHTLGFPVGGEVPGLFRHYDKWYPIDITRIPMGQSIAATALQMHQAMSTIANGGVLLRPQVIKEIRDASNAVVYRYDRAELNRVVSEKTARTIAKLLQGVASVNGTAPEAAIKLGGIDYEVAGKTGTAQKYMPEVQANGKTKIVPSRKHHVASFVGFFPASNPQVAISVIVDDADAHAVGGVAYGAKVAAPVFKSIGEKLIPILPITPPNQPARLDIVAASEGGRR